MTLITGRERLWRGAKGTVPMLQANVGKFPCGTFPPPRLVCCCRAGEQLAPEPSELKGRWRLQSVSGPGLPAEPGALGGHEDALWPNQLFSGRLAGSWLWGTPLPHGWGLSPWDSPAFQHVTPVLSPAGQARGREQERPALEALPCRELIRGPVLG